MTDARLHLVLIASLACCPASSGAEVVEVEVTPGEVEVPTIEVEGPDVGDDAEHEQAQREAPPAPPAGGVAIRVRPTNVSRQDRIQFGEDGGLEARSANMSLSFQAEVHTDLELLGTATPAVEALETLAGERLFIDPRRNSLGPQPLQAPQNRHRGGDAAGPPVVSFSVSIHEPPAARGVRSARGTLTLVTPDSEVRELRFVPLDRFLHRTAVVEGLGGAEFELKRQGPQALQVVFPERLAANLHEVGFAGPGGGFEQLQRGRAHTYQRDGQTTVQLQRDEMPEGGGVVLRMYPKVRELVVPWRCGPFELPTPDRDQAPRLALSLVAPDAPFPGAEPDGADPAPGPEPLPLRIVGEEDAEAG